MGNCLSHPHRTSSVPTKSSSRTYKPRFKKLSRSHLQPISQHNHISLITAIASHSHSTLRPPNRHVHFAPTPPLPKHTPTTKTSTTKTSTINSSPIKSPHSNPHPPTVRVPFTPPQWNPPNRPPLLSPGPLSPLTTPAPQQSFLIKHKPLPQRTNARTTFIPPWRSSTSAPAVPPKIRLSNSVSIPRALPSKVPLSPPPLLVPQSARSNEYSDRRCRISPPRISASHPYTPDLGLWECVHNAETSVRSGGVERAWMSGALGAEYRRSRLEKGGEPKRVKVLRRREGGWFRRVSDSGGRRFSKVRKGG